MTTYEDIYKKMITEGNSMDWSNALNRSYAIPLEKYSVFNELSTAEEYALNNPVAYEGQIITVSKDGITKGYVLDSSEASGLKEIADEHDIEDLTALLDISVDNLNTKISETGVSAINTSLASVSQFINNTLIPFIHESDWQILGAATSQINDVDEKYEDIIFGDGISVSNKLEGFDNASFNGGFSIDFRDFTNLSSNGERYVRSISYRNPSNNKGDIRDAMYLYVYEFVGTDKENWTYLSNYQLIGISKNSCLNATLFDEKNYNTFEFNPFKMDFEDGLYLLYPSYSKDSETPSYRQFRTAVNTTARQFNSKFITAPSNGIINISQNWTNEFVFKTCSIDKDLYDSIKRIDYISSDYARRSELPGKATESERGTVAVGFTTDDTSKNYAVQLSGDNAYVHVNWTGGSAGDVAVDDSTIKKKTDGTN